MGQLQSATFCCAEDRKMEVVAGQKEPKRKIFSNNINMTISRIDTIREWGSDANKVSQFRR
jgi:hypothetical protein